MQLNITDKNQVIFFLLFEKENEKEREKLELTTNFSATYTPYMYIYLQKSKTCFNVGQKSKKKKIIFKCVQENSYLIYITLHFLSTVINSKSQKYYLQIKDKLNQMHPWKKQVSQFVL